MTNITSKIWRYKTFDNVKQGDIIIDLGACVGNVTKRFADVNTEGLIISVEPEINNYKKLVQLSKQYNNVIPIFGGIGSHSGISHLYIGDQNESPSTWWKKRFHKYPLIKRLINIFSWDDLMDMLNIDKVDFLKIDVNGAETQVFEGMTKVFPKLIFLESSAKIPEGTAFYKNKEFEDRLLSIIKEKGYIIKEEVKYWYVLELCKT